MRRTSLLLAGVSACTPTLIERREPIELPPDLAPVVESIEATGPGSEYFSAQPPRDHPYALAFSADGAKLYVALRGDEAEPRSAVAVLDAGALEPRARIDVGRSPNHLELHPSGRYLLVANRFSAYLSVIDTASDREIQRLPTPYYATELAFDRAGRRLWISNRHLDSVLAYDVEELDEGGLSLSLRDVPSARLRDRLRGQPGIPTGIHPRGLALDEEGGRLFVANMMDLTVSVLDLAEERELDTDADPTTGDLGAPPGVTRLHLYAPANDVAVIGRTLYVATGGRGTGHPAQEGPDTEGDGQPGDGTANLHFHDLQNELALFDTRTLAPGPRYSSDSALGFFDDAPEGSVGLPPVELRIVRGALPEQLVVYDGGRRLAASMAASGELTIFAVAPDGSLRLADETPCDGLFAGGCTGLFPYGVAADADGNLAVANRLSEDVAWIPAGSRELRRVVVGDVSGGPFPATDSELGEIPLWMTALYSADGDPSCEHCHRESSVMRKPTSAPHGLSPFTVRNVPPMRDLLLQRPLMFEGFLTEKNFSPMMDEFGRAENFRPGGARAEFTSRDEFFLATNERLFGRRESFGDAMPRRPLDFDGVATLMGLALIREARLLPNPNPRQSYAVERGRALFESIQTGCSSCHAAPRFTVSGDFNPTGQPLLMQSLSPNRFGGVNIDLIKPGHKARFGTQDDRFGSPSLRGLWDRPAMFFHDGRARSLKEALATPGHRALGPRERGMNELDGVPDRHGGTSQLSPEELDDLIEYLRSIE